MSSDEVRLWNTSYGDYTDKEPEPCGCDADPDHGPHHQDGTRIREFIALPAAKHAALMRVVLAARCWRDTVIFPNEENGSEVDLCAALDALPRDQQPGRAGGGA